MPTDLSGLAGIGTSGLHGSVPVFAAATSPGLPSAPRRQAGGDVIRQTGRFDLLPNNCAIEGNLLSDDLKGGDGFFVGALSGSLTATASSSTARMF